MPFLDLLARPGRPAAPALTFERSTFSRSELADQAMDLASRLTRAGVEPRSKVLVALPNSPAFLVSLIAVNQCGAVFMPLNPALGPEERRRIDEIARPDVVLEEKGEVELVPGVGCRGGRVQPMEMTT